MSAHSLEIHDVLHPSDFTDDGGPAFAHALRIAIGTRARLQLLHVNTLNERARWSDFPRVRSTLAAWKILPSHATTDDVAKLGLRVVKTQRSGVEPASPIANYIRWSNPDLVVLAIHQRSGLDKWTQRSSAEPIARRTRRITLFVPCGIRGFVSQRSGRVRLRTILVPVNEASKPHLAAEAAALMARAVGSDHAHFIFLFIGNRDDMPRVNVPAERRWSSEHLILQGNVVEHILAVAAAEAADLIVMATQGHSSLLDAVLGSTTERVLREARCPVLAVPATGRGSL